MVFYSKRMKRGWAILLLSIVAGTPSARAQIQLVPSWQPMAKPIQKAPKAAREASTRGNFPRRMKREDVEALFFNGNPVEAAGLGRASFRVTFFKNGEAARLDNKSGETKRGTWRWLGDGYCSKWEKAHESCYTIVKDGEVYKIVRGTRAVAFWSTPEAGKNVKAKDNLPPPPAEASKNQPGK